MLAELGHTVFVYGGPDVDCPGAQAVEVIGAEDRARWFGPDPADILDRWNRDDPCWAETNTAIIAAVADRLEPYDIIGITAGACQQPIAAAFPNHVVCEPGIGYEAPLRTTHWCVESEAWRHWLYGRYGIGDGRFYDTVIRNAYDTDQFGFCDHKDDYLLYLGRMTARKGLAVVAELAKSYRVVTAGPGDERVPGADHIGVVIGDEKKKLLAGARALLAPTLYIGPFEGVTVEAMCSGTPVITTPWGAFSETVIDKENGSRCSTLAEFHDAVGWWWDADDVRRRMTIQARHWYSIKTVGPAYGQWLERLAGLYGRGWYQ